MSRTAQAAAPVPASCAAVPSLIDRVAGAVVAVLGAEDAFITGHRSQYLVAGGTGADALLWVARDYIRDEMLLGRRAGIIPQPPVWVLPVAVIHRDARERQAEIETLARGGGVTPEGIPSCVAYGDLVVAILTGRFDRYRATEHGRRGHSCRRPRSTVKDGPALAYQAARWAAARPQPLTTILHALRPLSLSVHAAAAGVIGLRDGLTGLPNPFTANPERTAAGIELARQLIHAWHRNEAST